LNRNKIVVTDGAFQMWVDDVLQPGTPVIEASTNLAVWAPVSTNSTPTNTLFYTDPDASNHLRRFYRAFHLPYARSVSRTRTHPDSPQEQQLANHKERKERKEGSLAKE
jgi:hypothetical protein